MLTTLVTKNEAARGRCYEFALRMLNESVLPDIDIKLCHGIVRQNKPPYVRMGHAWLEERHPIGVMVRDTLYPNALIQRDYYYTVGRIEARTVKRYTKREAVKRVLTTELPGPWDPTIAAAAHCVKKYKYQSPVTNTHRH